MAIEDDISVALNGNIRYEGGGSTYYTVLELHRFLQDLADDQQASGDDLLDITNTKPSERSTDNIIELISPYNIDDDCAEQLYDGSITQEGGDTVYSGLVVVGSVETGTQLQIFRNNTEITSWWSTGINQDLANNIILRVIIKTRDDGVDIDGKRLRVQAREFGDTYAEFLLTAGLGNSTAAIFTSEDLNNTTAQATVNAWDCSNTEGYQLIDLNNGNGAQPYYSQWDLGSRTLINDLYEFTKDIQRRTTAETIHGMNGKLFRGISHEFDYDNESGNFTEDETVGWGCTFAYTGESGGPFTVGERLDFGTSNAIGILILLDDQGTTGNMVIQVVSGTPGNGNTITGYTSSATATVNSAPADVSATAGTGILLALDDNGATGTMWIQLLTGGPPVDGLEIRGNSSVETCDVDGSITARTIVPEFIGQSTGTSIIGAFGIGIDPNDLSSADLLFDLLGASQSPPNNQTFTVQGLISGEDRVMVAKNDGADEIDYDQYALNTTLSGATETAVVVTTAISGETPQTGTIRIELDTGVYRYQAYTSWTASTFTIGSTDYSGANQATAGNNVFTSYIDLLATGTSESFIGIYSSDVSLVVKVRDGASTPIKPFKTAATFGSGGGSVTAIRTSDA